MIPSSSVGKTPSSASMHPSHAPPPSSACKIISPTKGCQLDNQYSFNASKTLQVEQKKKVNDLSSNFFNYNINIPTPPLTKSKKTEPRSRKRKLLIPEAPPSKKRKLNDGAKDEKSSAQQEPLKQPERGEVRQRSNRS